MIRDALERMALGERATIAGVEVERFSILGFRLAACPVLAVDVATMAALVERERRKNDEKDEHCVDDPSEPGRDRASDEQGNRIDGEPGLGASERIGADSRGNGDDRSARISTRLDSGGPASNPAGRDKMLAGSADYAPSTSARPSPAPVRNVAGAGAAEGEGDRANGTMRRHLAKLAVGAVAAALQPRPGETIRITNVTLSVGELRGEVPEVVLCGEASRAQERLKPGPEADARIAELRRQHGRALRVTGRAKAKRARWTGQEVWLVASYPKEET